MYLATEVCGRKVETNLDGADGNGFHPGGDYNSGGREIMGRPSKLSEKKWAEIEKRLLAGESIRSVAKTYGVGEATIRGRGISAQVAEIKDVAKQIVSVQERLSALPVSAQVSAHSLADELRAISSNLASAAKYGSMTAHRLSVIAHVQTDRLDDAAPLEENTEALKSVMAMTRGANDAAAIGLNLMSANKDAMKAAPAGPSKIRLVIEGVGPNAS